MIELKVIQDSNDNKDLIIKLDRQGSKKFKLFKQSLFGFAMFVAICALRKLAALM